MTRGFWWRPGIRRVVRALLVTAAVGLLVLVGFRVMRHGALPDVVVGGRKLGGLHRDEVAARMEALEEERRGQAVTIVRRATEHIDADSRRYRKEELGYDIDVDATVERVMRRGRQGNPLTALVDHLRATFAAIEVQPVASIDGQRFDAWVKRAGVALSVEPRAGDLRFDGADVRPVMPRPGAVLDEQDLRSEARRAVRLPTDRRIEIAGVATEPDMDDDAVRNALDRAREILSRPVRFTRGGRSATFAPAEIGATLDARVTMEEGRSHLEIVALPGRLREVGTDQLRRLNTAGRDARFVLRDGRVRVVRHRDEFAVSIEDLASRLVAVARSRERSARAPGERVEPSLTTKEARGYRIDERVSSFTTYHSCCQPRVQNIHRIAELLDGEVVAPGDGFSLNETVGQRTRAKGFVGAPSIRAGRYVEEVGGGISQFATTFFNAVFFGGYDFLEYQPHSYYISRYPPGREATVSWPAPDLRFANDSEAGIYIDTSYTDTSITVTFYGKSAFEVISDSGRRHNFRDFPTRCRENDDLARGERRVVQEGARGFDIVVFRVFRGTERDRERFFTRYDPQPQIIERRNCR